MTTCSLQQPPALARPPCAGYVVGNEGTNERERESCTSQHGAPPFARWSCLVLALPISLWCMLLAFCLFERELFSRSGTSVFVLQLRLAPFCFIKTTILGRGRGGRVYLQGHLLVVRHNRIVWTAVPPCYILW